MPLPRTSQTLLMETGDAYCYMGECPSKLPRKAYRDTKSVRQHQVRAHPQETETTAKRTLKRKREAEAEELQKRQRLEEEERIAASRVQEPEPPRPVRYQASC